MKRWFGYLMAIGLVAAPAIFFLSKSVNFINPLSISDKSSAIQAQAAILQAAGSIAGIVVMIVLAVFADASRKKERKDERDAAMLERSRKLRVFRLSLLGYLSTLCTDTNQKQAKYLKLQPALLSDRDIDHLYMDTILTTDGPIVMAKDGFHELGDKSMKLIIDVISKCAAYQELHGRLSSGNEDERRRVLEDIGSSLHTVLENISAGCSSAMLALRQEEQPT